MSNQTANVARRSFRQIVSWLVPAAIAIGFLVFVWIDRREVFKRLKYSIVDGDNWLPYVWCLIAIVLLALLLRRVTPDKLSRTWRSWRALHLILLAVTGLVALGMLLGKTGWGRYQAYRWECFHQHLGITARDRGETEEELVSLLTDPHVASWLHRDAEMLTHLSLQRSDLFARRPCEANLALRSILRSGTSLKEFRSAEDGESFLVYALAGNVFPIRDDQVRWLVKANAADKQKLILDGLLIESLLRSRINSISSLSDHELEALVFCVANYPESVDADQRLKVQTAWLERVPEFTTLLAEGYALGQALQTVLDENQSSKVRVRMVEGRLLPVEAQRKQVSIVLQRALQSLAQLTCSVLIQFAHGNEDASAIDAKLSLDGGALKQYQRQVFQWRQRFEGGGIRPRVGSRSIYLPGRWVDESVPTGETTTATVYGATVKLGLASALEPIKISPTLVYWQDYLRDNKSDSELESIGYEKLSGRVWPLGIHESYFRGGDAFAERNNQ